MGKKEKTVGMDKMEYGEEEERPLIQTKPLVSSAASGMHAANECGRSSDPRTTWNLRRNVGKEARAADRR